MVIGIVISKAGMHYLHLLKINNLIHFLIEMYYVVYHKETIIMSYVIALDLKGHLVELSGSFPTYQAVLEYLHKWYNNYNELTVYIMD